ncbi:MAG: DUF4440 domain-containing protein [Planctomycetota bacterium]
MNESIRSLAFLAVMLVGAHPAAADQTQEEAIRAMLHAQVTAWNEGDLSGFMSGYWNSDGLTFSSGGRITRGWQPTLERYQARYDTREKMGQLTFSDLEIRPLGDDYAFALGRWKLDKRESMQGNFTLVLKRTPQGWVIMHDHTSLLPTES